MPGLDNRVLPPRRNLTQGFPTEQTNLTASEKALLPDPNVVTEDDADAIVGMRRVRAARGKTYSLEQVLRENGIQLARSVPARRAQGIPKARRQR